MKTITIEVPDDMMELAGGSDEELAAAMRLATAILWYQQGRISQGKAAEIAGMNRTRFLRALGEARIDVFQISEAELQQEVERGLEAQVQRLASDLPHEAAVAGDPE
jgi:predicted HTH domain antitoxin